MVYPVTVAPVSAPYRPGQAPWPENQPQRPDRPPPIRFHEEPPASGRSSGLDWTLRIIGLVAVAVVSGFLWWFLNNEPPADDNTVSGGGPTSEPPPNAGEFEFALAEIDEPIVDESCSDHAYGQIKDFLSETPCEQLIRAIYSTEIEDEQGGGTRTVYTSVSVVEMAEESTAEELRELTDTENTGNVSDLIREGEVRVPGLETLSKGGGYDSSQDGTSVIIVEADYDPAASENGTEDELDNVCGDALRLSKDMIAEVG
jgi:hypothetical protein